MSTAPTPENVEKSERIANVRIICPKCATEYFLDAAAIAADGTAVQCSACEHSFTVYGDANFVPREGEAPAPPPPPAPAPAPATPPAPAPPPRGPCSHAGPCSGAGPSRAESSAAEGQAPVLGSR